MSNRGSLLIGSGIFKQPCKKNFHVAHFSDSNRAYWCNCFKSIRVGDIDIYPRGKRNEGMRIKRSPSPSFNLWKFNHPN